MHSQIPRASVNCDLSCFLIYVPVKAIFAEKSFTAVANHNFFIGQ